MKKGYKKLLIISIVLIALLILNNIFQVLNNYTYVLFLFVIFVSTILQIGFEKDNYLFKKDIIMVVIISCIFYLILTYASGLLIGFIKTVYNLAFLSILKTIIPFFLIICLEELIRYNLVRKGSRNKLIIFLVVIISIFMDITLIVKSFDLFIGSSLVEFIFVYVIPSVFKNVVLTYISYKGGYKPTIIYRIIMELSMYILPIFPNLGSYMETSLKVLFPAILMFIIYRITRITEEKKDISNYQYKKIWLVFLMILTILIVGINCGWFKYYSVTIGSGSMAPKINKGDVIVIEKLNKSELKELKIGDILVFKKENKVIVHRITEIQIVANKYLFQTKGDANENIDSWITEEKDVIGKTQFKISYIGYPSVWLSEFIENNV